MKKTLTQKILETHMVSGSYVPGNEIAIRIDQTLTQDATGTMAYLQFESLRISRVKTELSVSYVDHNTVQIGYENADDHRYLQSVAEKFGIYFSRPGNGICHQVHLERFGRPGKTLIGSDSHTPTGGALGMIAIGAGGLDVALAMAGEPFYLTCPKVIKIYLLGRLQPWVSAKDIILKVLDLFGTKGNVGYVFEYDGPGLETLTVPERATIANMGAECGVTTSVFPSDAMTRRFLKAQQREGDWIEIRADRDSEYDRVVEIDLSDLIPLTAKPSSPGNISPIRECGPVKIRQVCLGSCTNSSYKDLATVAQILKGKVAHPDVSFIIAPGSKQVLENLARDGHLADLLSAGARLMENACGFCIGNSQSPPTGSASLRTSNRNFPGRSGTLDAEVYIASPEAAAASIITGKMTDPRDLGIPYPEVSMPETFYVDDRMILKPKEAEAASAVIIYRGPNIGPPPTNDPLPIQLDGVVTLKVRDNITTDHIIPAGKRMKYRSNIPKYAEYLFEIVDNTFYERAMKIKESGRHNVIVAGLSYGQGSSREHAALCPMYVGVKAVLARSFERIHAANLVNFGILPLTFLNEEDYDRFVQGDEIHVPDIRNSLSGPGMLQIHNVNRNIVIEVSFQLTERQKQILLAGGALNRR